MNLKKRIKNAGFTAEDIKTGLSWGLFTKNWRGKLQINDIAWEEWLADELNEVHAVRLAEKYGLSASDMSTIRKDMPQGYDNMEKEILNCFENVAEEQMAEEDYFYPVLEDLIEQTKLKFKNSRI